GRWGGDGGFRPPPQESAKPRRAEGGAGGASRQAPAGRPSQGAGEPGLMALGVAGRKAIVTGGSKGLGKAITADLMAEGASVVICSRHVDELEATSAELAKNAADGAGTVHALRCDVTDPDHV